MPALAGLHGQEKPTPTSQLLRPMESLSLAGKSGGAPGGAKEGEAQPPQPLQDESARQSKNATEITCTKEAAFDDKSRKATFTGEVRVKDPQFDLTADRLTAYIRRETIASGTTATPAPAKNDGKAGNGTGGLERAIAEGHVVIIQDKPGENGEKPERYVAKAGRAEFNAATGDMVLSIWPQVQQGINLHVASEESTVMTINRDGRMKTSGRSRTLIQDQPDEPSKKQ
jgi:lipopolysaccharide export system protein LptA